VAHEIRDRHFAREDESDGLREQAQQQQETAKRFEDAGKPNQRHDWSGTPPGMMAAGNASSLAVPNCMKRNAATIRRRLSR